MLTGKPTETFSKSLRRRSEDNIRMDPEEMGINTRNWVDSDQNRDYWRALVKAAFNQGFHKLWS